MTKDVPAGWALARVDDVLLGVEAGKSEQTLERRPTDDEVGVVKVSAVTWGEFDASEAKAIAPSGFDPTRSIRRGDLLFSRANTAELAGAVVVAREDHPRLMLSDKILRLRLGEGMVPRFVMFALRTESARAHLEGSATGTSTSMRNITQENLRATPLLIPPAHEQRRIVDKLDAVFERTRAARARLESIPAMLDQLRQSILAAAFRGDLTKDWREAHPDVAPVSVPQEPKGGRHRGRRVDHVATMPGLCGLSINDPDTPTPRGWSWVKLDAVARLESGHTPSRRHPEYWDGGIHWLGILDARDHHGSAVSSTAQTISTAGLENSSARLLPAGTVCLVRTSFSLGYVVVLAKEMATSQDFADWVCSDALLPRFLMYALLAEGAAGLRRFAKGSHHPTIYYPELQALHVKLPPVDEQRVIVDKLDRAMSSVAALQERAAFTLAQSKEFESAALAQAFRGELVHQDPNDEPASVLLERIRAQRAAEVPAKRTRGRPKAAPAAKQNGSSDRNGHDALSPAGEPLDLVVAVLVTRGRASSADVQDATGLDAAAIRPVLKSLERLGKVAVEGKARGTAYRWLG